MERVMAELSERFARDKLRPDTSKAVLSERMRAEARAPTRDAIAVRRPRTWLSGRRRCWVFASPDRRQDTLFVDRLFVSVPIAVWRPCARVSAGLLVVASCGISAGLLCSNPFIVSARWRVFPALAYQAGSSSAPSRYVLHQERVQWVSWDNPGFACERISMEESSAICLLEQRALPHVVVVLWKWCDCAWLFAGGSELRADGGRAACDGGRLRSRCSRRACGRTRCRPDPCPQLPP